MPDIRIEPKINIGLGVHITGTFSPEEYYAYALPEKEEDDDIKLSDSDIKDLVNIAEREVISKFTTNDFKIEIVNHNNISSETDVDNIIDYLAKP